MDERKPATGNVLGGDSYFPPLPRRGSASAQIVRGRFSMYTMFLPCLPRDSRSTSPLGSIYITNPYFSPMVG
jgi:hypothetical protein